MIERMHVKCTNADVVRAELEVKVDLAGGLARGAEIRGMVRGPLSERSHTLPAEFPLRAESQSLLRGVIIDPCYSSDALDMQYNVTVQIVGEHGEVLNEERRQIRLSSQNRG